MFEDSSLLELYHTFLLSSKEQFQNTENMMSGLMAVHHSMSNRSKKRRTLTTTTRNKCPPSQDVFYDWSDHPLVFQSLLVVEECREQEQQQQPEETEESSETSVPDSSTRTVTEVSDTTRESSVSGQTPSPLTTTTTPTSLGSLAPPQTQKIVERIRKKVTFTTCQVREYNVTIGIHPICVDGLPLSLDWDYTDQQAMDLLEEHESTPPSPPQRPRFPRRLDYEARKEYLQNCTGMTEAELWVAEQELGDSDNVGMEDPCSLEEEMSCTSKVLHRASALVNFDNLFHLE